MRKLFAKIRSPVVNFICGLKVGVFAWLLGIFLLARSAYADWTPLVTADNFTGPQADLMTTVGGALVFTLIVMAAGLVIGMLRGGR